MHTRKSILRTLATTAIVFCISLGIVAQKKDKAMEQQVFYRTVTVDGLSIFYREAGRKDAPTILLLHGLPSSSRMFQPLLKRLADNYHLVAPDYPGYGHSDWPDPKQFDYTFDHVAAVMDDFVRIKGLSLIGMEACSGAHFLARVGKFISGLPAREESWKSRVDFQLPSRLVRRFSNQVLQADSLMAERVHSARLEPALPYGRS